MFDFFFDYFFLLVGVLLGVAFFTLFERKVLGYIHFRKGPVKVFFFSFFQPFSDAIKLFSKEFLKGYKVSFYFFLLGPLFGLFLMMVVWSIYFCFVGVYGSLFSLIYLFCFMSLGVYFLLFCGWGSGSLYCLFGCYRSVSQTLSYEIVMIFFVFVFVYFIFFYDLFFFRFYQGGYWFFFFNSFFCVGWMYVCFSENNRTPFDFSEGESEIVSGFNVEYGGGFFSLVFICEYGMVIFFSFFSIFLFFGAVGFFLKLVCFCFFYVWVRCSFPRYRYDFLMASSWKMLLPFCLFFLFVVIILF